MSDELRALVVWLPSPLVNTLNKREHWTVDAKRARRQRDAVCAAVYTALARRRFAVGPTVPKHVRFDAFVARPFDGDGLQAALKHVRDGLIDASVIDDDRDASGHVFEYQQWRVTEWQALGVRITITLRNQGGERATDSDPQARA
jgi:hypothetical protein